MTKPRHGEPYTIAEEHQIRKLVRIGTTAREASILLGRNRSALYDKTRKLGLHWKRDSKHYRDPMLPKIGEWPKGMIFANFTREDVELRRRFNA